MGAISESAAHLYLRASESSRSFLATYYNVQRPLYFHTTRIACRTASQGECRCQLRCVDFYGDRWSLVCCIIILFSFHMNLTDYQISGCCTKYIMLIINQSYHTFYIKSATTEGQQCTAPFKTSLCKQHV